MTTVDMGTSFHGGLACRTGRGLMPMAYVWNTFLGWVSLHTGVLLGNVGWG